MPHDSYLQEIVIIIAMAVFVVALFKKLKLSPVLGYFVAGGVLGEHGLKVVTSTETEFFGEIGIVFLLFAIGLELTFERLKAMRLHVFGFGTLQVVISAIFLAWAAYFFDTGLSASIIIGGGIALSSTAIVMQVIAENREQSTQVGRLSLAILLMQDFAVVPLLVLVPILAGEQKGLALPMAEAVLKAFIALVMIFIMGRLFLRPLFSAISSSNTAKSNELFIAATLLVALGTAWITHSMGLSSALGAFAAGLLVAETEFHLQAEESISPFKALLLGLFFMSVGMSIDLALIVEQLPVITLLSFGIMALKAIIIIILCLIFKFTPAVAIKTGLLLSQGGEFSFILFRMADNKGIIDAEISQMLLLVVTITMAFTPLVALIGSFIAEKIEGKVVTTRVDLEIADLENHVIILGFGRVGKMVARILEAENVNYIAIDIDAEHVSIERQEGFPIYLGDSSDLDTLISIGTNRASSVIIAMENQVTMLKSSKVIHANFPDLPIVVRSEDLSDSDMLYEAGIQTIVPETYETGLQLGGAVLKSIGISEYEVSRIKNQFRAGNYVKLPLEENEDDNDNKNTDKNADKANLYS